MKPENGPIMKDEKQIQTVYYGVYTPNEVGQVFEDKLEALKVVKKNKKSRFKAFSYYHEAIDFCVNGSEFPNNNTVNGSLSNKISAETSQAVGEKSSPFKGPKPQELVELRKAIETGNIKFVRDTIWQNPRYLVSSGDTPSILQEGSRYNALHVAAKSRNAEITELILNTISDAEFFKLLYGDDNQDNAEDRTAVLLDLYLNMPNKGLNETPLHFASKHGAPDVVEILVSYPQCDKTLKNKFQKTADQIICERAECDNTPEIRKKIELLLKDSYYVPVLRSEDNSLAPVIGEPFSPSSPPVLNGNPLSPRLEIHAYAGPMEKRHAHDFRRKWKTPPRSLTFASNASVSALRFKDPQKGLERIGNKLANELDVTWKEYWPFLGAFVDLASEEGLRSLDAHLASRQPHTPENIIIAEPLSPVADLCAAFSACRLSDADAYSTNYIEKACQVFANRICNDVQLYGVAADGATALPQVLETEVKQLELLMASYMEDDRFARVDFQKVHSRLGQMVARKLPGGDELRAAFEPLLATAGVVDRSSSDDDDDERAACPREQRRAASRRRQLDCLARFALQALRSRGAASDGWAEARACACAYRAGRVKKNSVSKGGGFRGSGRRLFFEDEGVGDKDGRAANGYNLDCSMNQIDIDSDDSNDDKFYTPPSSPSFISDDDSDSDDEFNDTELPKSEIFIEGDHPTRMDRAVFNALCYADVKLDSKKYPNVYKWHHTVSLYSSEERKSWPASKDTPCAQPIQKSNLNSSFSISSPRISSTPVKSWLRITGANSPKAVIKSRSMHL